MSTTTGTITVTNGSTAVIGSGTNFASGKVGKNDCLWVGGGVYLVDFVTSDTELTLKQPYEGTSGSGKAYNIVHLTGQTYIEDMDRLLAQLVERYANIANSVQTTAIPGGIPRAGADGKISNTFLDKTQEQANTSKIAENTAKNAEQDTQIAENTAKNAEQDASIASLTAKNAEQDGKIEENTASIQANTAKIEENTTAIATKQDKLTFDSTPTQGSLNPVTSGGVWKRFNQADIRTWYFEYAPHESRTYAFNGYPIFLQIWAVGTLDMCKQCFSVMGYVTASRCVFAKAVQDSTFVHEIVGDNVKFTNTIDQSCKVVFVAYNQAFVFRQL